jgi:hypothetical protein
VVYDTEDPDRGSAALPDTYGMSADDLANLIHRYRMAATQQQPG